MDTKVTLSFDKDVIDRAKSFAEENNISLSRLTEYLYTQITSKNYKSLENLPVSDWVDFVAKGRIEYRRTPNRKDLKDEFFSSKK
ncbi:DUF6364 family protein [Algoriphagus chordae]|uniref:RelB antitoxin of RelBE toxin-antitoxin system n=1 Tax=Algoriphagus chordae TaxID=237019 RepID=A0A2W7QS93_9BACT|nr:DUF6364 family protein [Algoriphagus chordae]PZX48920.1 hypothetical protein LV85_03410 [Algoriphagus chordae]